MEYVYVAASCHRFRFYEDGADRNQYAQQRGRAVDYPDGGGRSADHHTVYINFYNRTEAADQRYVFRGCEGISYFVFT